MNDLQAIADRVEIEALRAEFTDAAMMADFDRMAALFTSDGVWRIPDAQVEITGRAEIRAGIERLRGLWEFFVQNTHPGFTAVEGDTGIGRAYVVEFGRFRDGASHLNYAIYHDRYERTPDGWKFAERAYEVRYSDSTDLAGQAAKPGADRPGIQLLPQVQAAVEENDLAGDVPVVDQR